MKCWLFVGCLVALMRIGEGGYFTLPFSLRPSQIHGKICDPDTKWQSRCNPCVCSSDGRPLCEQQGCPGQDDEKELYCSPGSRWMSACNSCWCTAEGRAMCTRMGCEEGVAALDFSAPDEKQTETKTLEVIPKSSNKTIVCVANRMFIKDCNTCWCNEDGTSFFCTRKVCIPELPEDVSSDDDKIEELRLIRKECRPDEVFEVDCNMCRCNPDGKSFSCTRRACVEQSEDDSKNENTASRRTRGAQLNNKEQPKTCQPGQEFRMDCNKCLCDDEGQDFSCTRIDCNALNNNNNGGSRRKRETSSENKETISAECSPGSVFDRGCNVCRCLSDGLRAECTTNTCPKPDQENKLNNNPNLQPSETDLGFRCNPGEQFKRSCNDCTCSADGRSVFCSLRLCDKDFIPRD